MDNKGYFFCGIGGSGMSALAEYLIKSNVTVYGSDRSFDNAGNVIIKEKLSNLGIKLFPQDGSGITDFNGTLVISSAIENSIPDVAKAIEKGLNIIKRSDLLAEIFHTHRVKIAIGGTSGKTTVTAMVGHIMRKAGLEPTIINGGNMLNLLKDNPELIGNSLKGNKNFCVIEADESDGSIEKYLPSISVINNISLDHKPISELHPLFQHFAGKADIGTVLNIDCTETSLLKEHCHKAVTVSLKDRKADIYLQKRQQDTYGISYSLEQQEFKLQTYGEHNVYNAGVAIATASLLDIPPLKAAEYLSDFAGTERRFQIIGTNNKNITVIDDFAHNPEKISATLTTLAGHEGRIVALYQPHGFAPTRLAKNELITALGGNLRKDDILIMPEIFFAGGTATKDISSNDILEEVSRVYGNDCYFFENRSDIISFLSKHAIPNDTIIIMGARDNSLSDFANEIYKSLSCKG